MASDKLIGKMRLKSWVEPMLKDLYVLQVVGFISQETFQQILVLLVQDGMEFVPLQDLEA